MEDLDHHEPHDSDDIMCIASPHLNFVLRIKSTPYKAHFQISESDHGTLSSSIKGWVFFHPLAFDSPSSHLNLTKGVSGQEC
jgi:hypothetical protein